MRKLSCVLITVVLTTAFALFAFGCSGSHSSEPIVGNWNLYAATGDDGNFEPMKEGYGSLSVNPDGTLEFVIGDEIIQGVWKARENSDLDEYFLAAYTVYLELDSGDWMFTAGVFNEEDGPRLMMMDASQLAGDFAMSFTRA